MHRGVLASHTGELSYEQRVWAGVLHAGKSAVACRDSALWLADQKQRPPSLVHVLVPRRQGARRSMGLHVHRGDYPGVDLLPQAGPPRTRLERTVLDCAAATPHPDRAVALIAGAVQRGLTTAERLDETLTRLPTLPRRAMLGEALAKSGAGAHSLLEIEHECIRRSHRLPKPARQVRHGKARVDVDYDGLVVELDGRQGHFDVDGWWKDMLRDDLHTVAGRAVLRFPGFVLLTQPHLVAHLEAAALRRRGWTGPLRCPAGCPGWPQAPAA